jgi:hypothetical protein
MLSATRSTLSDVETLFTGMEIPKKPVELGKVLKSCESLKGEFHS